MENPINNLPDYPPLKTLFMNMHLSNDKLDDDYLDSLIGIQPKKDKLEDYHDYQTEFGVEQFIYEGTPYSMIREFLSFLKPSKKDIIYDLGSGYGRIVFYGALATPAFYKGIEIIPERIIACDEIKEKIKISNAEFICSNVLDARYEDGSIFFLFNPFYLETLEKVGEKLKNIAKSDQIKVVSWGGTSDEYFSTQKWLREISSIDIYFRKLKIFSSKSDAI